MPGLVTDGSVTGNVRLDIEIVIFEGFSCGLLPLVGRKRLCESERAFDGTDTVRLDVGVLICASWVLLKIGDPEIDNDGTDNVGIPREVELMEGRS